MATYRCLKSRTPTRSEPIDLPLGSWAAGPVKLHLAKGFFEIELHGSTLPSKYPHGDKKQSRTLRLEFQDVGVRKRILRKLFVIYRALPTYSASEFDNHRGNLRVAELVFC